MSYIPKCDWRAEYIRSFVYLKGQGPKGPVFLARRAGDGPKAHQLPARPSKFGAERQYFASIHKN